MAIKLQCGCGKALSIKDEFAGRQVKCPACQSLLRIPKPKVEEAPSDDEWDLSDSAEDDGDDDLSETRTKSRRGKTSPTRGSNSRQTSKKVKGKKSRPSSRGLLIGLSAGSGLLVIVLLAWVLWPVKPEANVAVVPNQNDAGSASAASSNTTSVDPGSQPNVTTTNPTPPIATAESKLEGDLKFLQGTWEMTDFAFPPDAPGAAEAASQMKLVTFTIKDDIWTMATPDRASFSSLKLDSTKDPRTIDLTPLEAGRPPQLGIYSIEGETWRMCTAQGGARPQEMKAAPGQGVITFKRSNAPPPAPASLFDLKAWLAAEGKLKTMKVNAVLGQWEKFDGIEGPTHCVMLTAPETSDGTMSPELWTIVSSLSHIALRTSFVTDATLRQLAQHPGLLAINMEGRSTVTADGIEALKFCPQLQVLVFHAPVSPEACAACSSLKQLQMLGIGNPSISKDLLSSIVQLSELKRLTLQNTSITDDDLLEIQKLTQLQTLMIGQTKVTDEGLKTLASLTNLTKLDLAGTKVTDQGLKTLASFRGLKMLWLHGLNVTPEAVAELQAALPNCKVLK